MDKRLVIHIGQHKTGSTYIQRMLFNGRKEYSQQGLCYPQLDDGYAHHNLGGEILRHDCDSGNSLWSKLKKTIKSSTYSTYLLSTESLDRAPPSTIEYLADRATELGLNVEIIMVIRNQIDCLESGVLGSNRYDTILRSAKEMFESAIGKTRFKYPIFVNEWINRFGKENVRIMVYEKSQPLLDCFLDLIGWCNKSDQRDTVSKINSRRDARVMLLVQQFLKTVQQVPEPNEIRGLISELMLASQRLHSFESPAVKQMSLFDDAFRLRVHRHYEKWNQQTHESIVELTDHYFSPDRDLEYISKTDPEFAGNLVGQITERYSRLPLSDEFSRFVDSVV